jgi:hypothetical protein
MASGLGRLQIVERQQRPRGRRRHFAGRFCVPNSQSVRHFDKLTADWDPASRAPFP